ncbi:MAG TPA: class I poly(R)-hydroxyalkanoic acid synthase, partial [Limnobacter sp.]|nr:class I poly(R)-hydroxyalkanoic acid synthase [Limnobacter sp.]
MNKQFSDFSEVIGQFLPVAEQIQQQMQTQMQHVMGAFGGLPGMQGLAPMNPVTMGAIAPFMNSVMDAFQHTLSQISVHSLGQIQSEYASELSTLVASAFSSLPGVDGKGSKSTCLDVYLAGDKRFAAPDWRDHGVYEFTAALYSLNAKFTRKIVDLVPEESPEKRRM